MKLTTEDLQELIYDSDGKQKELIERCREGDRQAFNQFIRKYQDRLFSHVSQMVTNPADAVRMTRDVFVSAYKAFPAFRGERPIEVWLFKIAEQSIRRRLHEHPPPHTRFESADEPDAQDMESLLLPYIDGELSDVEAKRVEEHLEQDAAFRQEYERLQHTDDLLHIFSQMSAPADLRVQINIQLDRPSFWQRVLDAIDVLRGIPPHRFITPSALQPSALLTRGSEGEEPVSQTIPSFHTLDPYGEIRREAEAKYDKAEFYKKHAKPAKAICLFQESLELYQQIEHKEGQMLTQHHLALLYNEIGKRDEAIQHARKFIKLYEALQIVEKYTQLQELLQEENKADDMGD